MIAMNSRRFALVAAACLAAAAFAPAAPAAPDGSIVTIGNDSSLAAAARADSVVAIFGNTRVEGSVDDSVVSILGNTYVDGKTGGDVVSVLGSVELGARADVGGDVVAVGGSVKRDPASIVRGQVQDVSIGPLGDFGWIHPWIAHCFLYARPLALVPGIAWAWWIALGSLMVYTLIALAFRGGLEECVRTIEARPGRTALAALLTILALPVTLILLCVTVIGIAAVPFVLFGLLCASLFGKAAVLAWLGRSVSGRRDSGFASHPAIAVLIGGVVVTALYLVPVVGLLAHQVFSLLGLGAVVYTIILLVRSRSTPTPTPTPTPTLAPAPTAAGGESTSPPASAAPSPLTPPPTAATAAAGMPRAGFWIRMGALFLDAVLIGVVTDALSHRGPPGLIALAVYGAVMWKLRGSTVGGIVFHLRVVRIDGREIDWPTAIVRALGCFLSLAVAGLGFIWIAFDEEKQSWHDKIAGTLVVRVPAGHSLV